MQESPGGNEGSGGRVDLPTFPDGVGCVRIDGEVWTARSYDEDEIIDAGSKVQVMEIRGATALVTQ